MSVLGPQNIPVATVLTLGNKVVLGIVLFSCINSFTKCVRVRTCVSESVCVCVHGVCVWGRGGGQCVCACAAAGSPVVSVPGRCIEAVPMNTMTRELLMTYIVELIL